MLGMKEKEQYLMVTSGRGCVSIRATKLVRSPQLRKLDPLAGMVDSIGTAAQVTSCDMTQSERLAYH
jgi:hypothetical protein